MYIVYLFLYGWVLKNKTQKDGFFLKFDVIFKLEGKGLLVFICISDFTLNLSDLRKTSDELQLEELLIKMDSLYVSYTLYAKTHSGELIWEYKVLDILGSNF